MMDQGSFGGWDSAEGRRPAPTAPNHLIVMLESRLARNLPTRHSALIQLPEEDRRADARTLLWVVGILTPARFRSVLGI